MPVDKPRLVIVGTGWAGFKLAQEMDQNKVEVTAISPQSTSPYTPLLAGAACGLFDFRLAEEPIRPGAMCVPALKWMQKETFDVAYDVLVLAPGCTTNTFDTPGVDEHAFFVKNVKDAMSVRQRLSDMLETASLPCVGPQTQLDLLHVIIVGGGPTGIEMAAELSDLFQNDLAKLYPNLAGKSSISVHDVAPHILAPYEKKLSEYATGSLQSHMVDIKVNSHILNVTESHVETKEDGKIPYGLLIWATGNRAVPLLRSLNVAKTTHGLVRILTDRHLRVRHPDGTIIPDVFALGDAADVEGETLPTTADVAVQKASYLLDVFNKNKTTPFQHEQRAMITYTGGKDGIVQGKEDYTGYAAWLGWRAWNLSWTMSWRRRIMIGMHWLWNWLDGREIARN